MCSIYPGCFQVWHSMDHESTGWAVTATSLREWGVGRRGLKDSLFDEPPPPRLGVMNVDDEEPCHMLSCAACSVPGCSFMAADVQQQTVHYESAHRYACSQCRRTLPSPRLLDLHLQEAHDSFFAVLAIKKPSYHCYTELCDEKFWNADDRFKHCVQIHKLPKDFRLERTVKKINRNKPKKGRMIHRHTSDSDETKIDMEAQSVKEIEKNIENGLTDHMKTRNTKPLIPKIFSFGQNKSKCFLTPVRKFSSDQITQQQVDMDGIITDLKNSLPES